MDFAFNASALVAGGSVERNQVITTTPSLGSVMLAPTGGEGRTVVSSYFSEELEIAQAETRVAGRRWLEKDEPRFTTWTSVLMRGVSIFGRVHVGEMGTTMTSTRGFDDGDDHEFDVRIWFRNVRVDGRKIDVVIDDPLMRMKRYDEIHSFLGSQRTAAESVAKRHDANGDALSRALKERKPVRVSLVETIKGWEHEALATIRVRGLGTLRFGELMLKPGQRRVNLILAEFGTPRSGEEAIRARVQRPDPGNESDAVHALNASDEAPSLDGPTGGSMILGSGEGNGTPVEP